MTARPVPLFDPGRGWPALRSEALATFERLAASGDFSLGDELRAFEAEYADYCGTAHCVGVASGTAAIELALRALGAGPESEVVTVAHTFVGVVEAIAATGACPVLVDVDPGTRCMDPRGLQPVLSDRTAAVVPVHLYGRPAPLGEIGSICAAAGAPLVEDAAQAHGALIDGRRAGGVGAAGAFSFYPTKNLGAMGDGGAVVTADEDLAATVRSLRHHGSAPGDANRHIRVGGTERLDNLQAALLRLKLPLLDGENEQRRSAAAYYRELLADVPVELPPQDAPDMRSVHHLFVIELDDRDRVRSALQAAGVAAAIHYPTPIHLQPAWRHLGMAKGDLPVSERLATRALSLPIFAGITHGEIERVVAALQQAVAQTTA